MPLMRRQWQGAVVYNSLPFFGSNGGVMAGEALARDHLIAAYNELVSASGVLACTVIESPFSAVDHTKVVHNHQDERLGQFTRLPAPAYMGDYLPAIVEASALRNLKKTQQQGVTAEIENDRLQDLRRMHQANMAAIGGTAKSDRFFTLLPIHFTAGEDYELFIARHQGRVIAGLLVIYFNRTAEYYMPATHHEFRELNPSSLLLVEALKRASARGCRIWNWGGTWSSQKGVYRFKRKWGGQGLPYRYYCQLNDPAVLQWRIQDFGQRFPNFYVVPFAALRKGEVDDASA